ncbi:hypothetical protein Bca52824_049563 [Brassica carinata]|uniref:Uncharacterized protein n=1 Tax=Brassica carinata TaxID=52824 RepID=A0A8X7RQP6_BRACI|nr:hypothetical protein Bca52824_049563 [Brassica carinata]
MLNPHCLEILGPTICLSVFDGMATLLHEKLVASCVEPKVFGGSLILNAPISTTTQKLAAPSPVEAFSIQLLFKASALHISRIFDSNQRPPLPNFAGNGGANNLGDDMRGAGAVKAQSSSNVTNVVPLNHTGMVACSVTEEATGASSCSVVEPVSGGVTADGAQLLEDVDVVKNHAMVSFPALRMSKLNARY